MEVNGEEGKGMKENKYLFCFWVKIVGGEWVNGGNLEEYFASFFFKISFFQFEGKYYFLILSFPFSFLFFTTRKQIINGLHP